MTSFLRSFFSKAAQPAPVVAAPELSEKAAPVKLPCRCADAATPVHSYMYQMVEMGITRLFMEKDIFNKIPEEGISVKDLADKIGAEFNLMERMIKVLVASRVFKSPSPGQIKHTDTSKMFGTKMGHLYFTHVFDYFTVSAAKWIEYFDTHGLQEPKKSSESPFGFGIGYPDKSLYEILEILPPHRAIAFNATMAMGIGEMSILDMYDFTWIGEAAKRSGNEARTVFVDVGGGKGQALRAILEANPEIPAERCVVEDREETIKEAEADSEGTDFARVKKVPISFFDEQPVKGSLVYYIRRVLNDWTDDEVVKILGNIRAACEKDSVLLISENILPDEPDLNLATADVWLMNFGGKRRNARSYREVTKKAGFEIQSMAKNESNNSTVIQLVPV